MHVSNRALYGALKKLVRLVPGPPQSPLDCVVICARAGRLQLTVSDGMSWLRVWLTCEGGDIQASLPARALLHFVRGAERDDIIELVADGDRIDVAYELCMSSLECGPDLPRAPDEDPSIEWQAEADWNAAELRAALSWVRPAVGRDVSQPNLSVVVLDMHQAVATDGHRLHTAPLAGPRSAPLTITRRAATVLALISGDGRVALERSGEHLRFQGDGWQLITRRLTTQLPAYVHAIQAQRTTACEIEVDAVVAVAALKALPLSLRSRSQGIQMTVNGQLVLERRDDNAELCRETVPVIRSTHPNDELEIGICAGYLSDALAGGGVKRFRFGGPLDPVVIDHADGRTAVVMPMRL